MKRTVKRRTKPSRRRRAAPIALYYWPTPNGWKISIMLEECALPYVVHPIDISKGEQFAPRFLATHGNATQSTDWESSYRSPENRRRRIICGSHRCTTS